MIIFKIFLCSLALMYSLSNSYLPLIDIEINRNVLSALTQATFLLVLYFRGYIMRLVAWRCGFFYVYFISSIPLESLDRSYISRILTSGINKTFVTISPYIPYHCRGSALILRLLRDISVR